MRVKLVELRTERNMTQAEAARHIHISRSHYSQIEAGDKAPSLETALRIKQVFEYEGDDIFLNVNAPKREIYKG